MLVSLRLEENVEDLAFGGRRSVNVGTAAKAAAKMAAPGKVPSAHPAHSSEASAGRARHRSEVSAGHPAGHAVEVRDGHASADPVEASLASRH